MSSSNKAYNKYLLEIIFKLMSNRELRHLIDRASAEFSNLKPPILTSDSDFNIFADIHSLILFDICNYGTQILNNNTNKTWKVSTPHIKFIHKNRKKINMREQQLSGNTLFPITFPSLETYRIP